MSVQEEILSAVDSPGELESLYRANPKAFTDSFPEVIARNPDSVILKVWNERLFFNEAAVNPELDAAPSWTWEDLLISFLIAVTAGTLMKIPELYHDNSEFFYARFVAIIVASSLAGYFLVKNKPSLKVIGAVSLMFLIPTLFMNFLPRNNESQTVTLSFLHLPFFLWFLVGVTYLSGKVKSNGGWMNFIRFNGEAIIYLGIIMIGGGILSMIFFGLFSMLRLNWIPRQLVIYGLTGAPIAAVFIVDRIVGARFKIAPLIAKVFAPVFFAAALLYVTTLAFVGRSPFTDREFLLLFNVLLFVVLLISIFLISEHGSVSGKTFADYINVLLVVVTIIIDLIALSAIVFRLSEYGTSPNRIAVLGANLLILGHLSGIFIQYVKYLLGKGDFVSLEEWIVTYLPVYSGWAALVTFIFPFLFWFK